MNYSAQFRNYLLNKNASKVTVKNYASDVNHFIRWFEAELSTSFSPDLITPETLDYYKKANSNVLSPVSLDRHFSSLRKFFKFLVLNGQIGQSPFDLKAPDSNTTEADPWKLKEFKDYLYVYNSSNLTIKNYINDVRQFMKWAEEVTKAKDSWIVEEQNIFPKLKPELLDEYRGRLITSRFSPRSVNRKLSSLRKYLSWARESGFIEEVRLVNQLNNLPKKQTLIATTHSSATNVIGRSYSKFPPLRVIQKAFHAAQFMLDYTLINPFAWLLLTLQQALWRSKGRPVFIDSVKRVKSLKNLPKEFYAPLSMSLAYLPLHKKVAHHLRYSRPKWYKRYHSISISHQLHWAILIVIMSAIGFTIYDSFNQNDPSSEQGEVLAALNSPPRLFSFQGKLTDAEDNPITTTTDIRFGIYDSDVATGGALLWQEVQTVTPDSEGVFSVLLGKVTSLSQSIFINHAGLWLGVTVGQTPELTPRQQIASVAFAQNSDLLQGLRPITQDGAGTENVVLALDSAGHLTIGGSATPVFQATGGQFTISGNVLVLSTLAGSDSNIVLRPDDIGKIDLQKPLQNSSHNNNITTAAGAVEVDDMFTILATSSGQSAFTIDQNDVGPLISASTSGTARFTVDNSGNTTISGNLLSALTASRDLGSSSVRWNNLWVQTINATGTNTSGQASFTYDPVDTTFAQGTVLLNPTSAGTNELLLGAGVGGVERASIDAEGDLVLGFAGGTVTRNSNPLTIYNHGTTQVASIDTSGTITGSGNIVAGGLLQTLTTVQSTSGNDLTLNANGVNRDIFLQVNGSTIATVQGSTSRVGVGTTGPIGTLNIQSADSGVTTASGNADELVIEGSGNTGISILAPNTATGIISFGDPQDNNVGNINYSHSENRMYFRVAGLNTAALDIDSSAEVGIGTTTPGNKLEVVDTNDTAIVGLFRGSNSGTSVGIYRQFAVLNQHTGVNSQTGIALQHYNASSVAKDAAIINATLSSVTAGSETGNLTISTISAGSLGERLRIDNGRVDTTGSIYIRDTGCNCQVLNFADSSGTALSHILNVGGISNGIRFAPGNNNRLTIFPSGTLYVGTDPGTDPGNKIFVPVGTASDPIADAWTTHSSGRWKENQTAIVNALDKLELVKPVYFDWKGEYGGKHDFGFIAEDIGKIFPEVVEWEADGIWAKSVDYAKLSTIAIAAIKELNEKVKNLESRSCVQSSSEFGLVETICSESTIEKLADSGTYAVKNYLGEVVTGGQILAEAVVGRLKAGYIEVQEIAASRIETDEFVSPVAEIVRVETDVIAPLSSSKIVVKLEDNSTSQAANSAPTLEIQDTSGSAVVSIDDEGNASFSGTLNSFGLVSETASIAGTLSAKNIVAENIESSLLTLKNQISSISGSLNTEPVNNYANIASYSAQLAYVDTLQAEVGSFSQGLFAVGPTSLSDATVFGQLSIGASLILADNSINVLGSDLEIQPLSQGGVSFFAGKVYIDTTGNLTTEGDATIKGTLFANALSPVPGSDLIEVQGENGLAVASIDTRGNATFRKLNFSLVKPAFALSETELIATGSAGIATISASFREVTIQNELVTEDSLIYISPVGTPSAQVPFLVRQSIKNELTGVVSSFTVGVQEILDYPLLFNWLIIN